MCRELMQAVGTEWYIPCFNHRRQRKIGVKMGEQNAAAGWLPFEIAAERSGVDRN